MKFILLLFVSLIFASCSKQNDTQSVTIYVSEDQVFSEPVLKAFEEKTGIRVNAVYDSEESKSTGVMNRLIAEKNNPQADVYWANEPIRAEVLRKKDILVPYESPNAKGIPEEFKQKEHYWTGFSARVRLFIVNKNAEMVPASVFDYAKPEFKGKGVIANPLFGTTTSHMAALFTLLGDANAKQFLEQMKANNVAIATSNGESADLVASGKYDFALVDSDDAVSRLKQHAPVSIIYPDQKEGETGLFVIPNTVMLITHAKHPEAAKKLIDFLLSPETEEILAFADCAQIPLHKGVKIPASLKPISELKVMKIDYAREADEMIKIQPYLKAWLDR
ncbi:iron ABC transporter substrate-binding protein [Sulfurovum lithotrophicum]|uniref:Iron ABC transporter substrate-binding protein n=2 Tax=Sulfurovum lithotrophicum TaxID=206403 RepID=A0A7U4RRP6_9BACT|nr:iron ABC transporter substrate-binding protein [Sulfurovum lithotrophicum]